MEKSVVCGRIYLPGSHRTISRNIYTDGIKYYIKYGSMMAEVINTTGFTNVTAGWKTVKNY